MPERSLRLLLAFSLCASFGIAFLFIATAISNESIAPFDTTVIGVIQGLEAQWLTTIMKTFTWIGSGYVVTLISLIGFIVLYFVLRFRQQAFLLVTVVAGSVVFNRVLKNFYLRERPEIHRIIDTHGLSFPSGHAMMAFALYAILAYIIWRNVTTTTSRIVLVLFTTVMITMIGTSRVYLGVHYPSDIVGGYLASALWITIAISIYAYFQDKRE